MSTRLTFFDVVRFAARYWLRQKVKLAFILVMLVASAGAETYLPTALSHFLGTIRAHSDQNVVVSALAIFLGTYLFQTMIFGTMIVIYNIFETHVFKMAVDDAFAHVYRLSEHFFVNSFAGSIISKITRGRRQLETFEDQIILRIFPTIMVLAGSTVFLTLHFPLLGLVVTAYMLVVFAATTFMVFRVSGPAQSRYADAQDRFTANLADSISGVTATKSYAQEKFEIAKFFGVTASLRDFNQKAYVLGAYASLVQRFLLTGMQALLLIGGCWYYFHGSATEESIAYLAFAYSIMQGYVSQLGENIKSLLNSSYDLHAFIGLLREPPEVPDLPARAALEISQGAIIFDHVGFTYPGKDAPIFENLTLSIAAGERVALVGHSGSGKTSFVRLLQCLYEVSAGRITIDGQDISQGSRQSLRGAIALVPQDPILFHRSLAENIAYGKPGATLDEIREAASKAHIADFIAALPQGYETLVGERGIKLSGGERQRIAIARAMLADRPILILDEATSSLDSASERAIQEALLALTHGRTSIMIAHRLSTILDADRILVFDRGRIVEEGTHEALLAQDGLYAEFFRLQSGGFIAD